MARVGTVVRCKLTINVIPECVMCRLAAIFVKLEYFFLEPNIRCKFIMSVYMCIQWVYSTHPHCTLWLVFRCGQINPLPLELRHKYSTSLAVPGEQRVLDLCVHVSCDKP